MSQHSGIPPLAAMDWRRNSGLGNLRVLTDDIICRILGGLHMQEVERLACVSSVFYIFCNDEPLWMRLCLGTPSDKPMVYHGTWKQTALARRAEEMKIALPSPHPLRRFEGFSSLHLYRQWYRCHIDLHTFSFDTGHVERRGNISQQEFAAEFDGKKPVLLTDIVGRWPASQEWTLPKLVDRFGDAKFKVSQAHGKAVKMTLRDYAAYTRVQHDEEPLYIFDPTYGETAPPLLSDYSVPPLFGDDFLELLEGELKPPFRWLVLGPPRSGAAWHVDPNLTSAWNALVRGKKRWALYPPGRVPPGVTLRVSEDDGDLSFDGPPSLQWWLDVYPHIPPDERPLECTQLPGETIFVPGGWWHCVLNIENSIAVTHNFLNEANFETVFSDLAPGFAHRGLSRAGRLAQNRSVDASPEHSSPADIAWSHFTDLTDDYVNRPALRELLRKMWAARPDLRSRIWDCACKTVGAEHWRQVLALVCAAHEKPSPSRGESLPVSGGRNAVFRVGGRVVKVFLGGGLEEDEAGVVPEVSAGHGDDGKIEHGNGQCLQNGRALSNGAGDVQSRRDHTCQARDAEDEDEENGGREQERMFRTELMMHELIRTAKSPLVRTVPALLGHGVIIEGEDGSLALEDMKSGGKSATEPGHANGKVVKVGLRGPAGGCLEDGAGIGNGANRVEGKTRTSGKGRAGEVVEERNVNGTVEEPSGTADVKRRWMYVIMAECEGTLFSDVYDKMSKGDLLALARFLGRQVGFIQALPLPPDCANDAHEPDRQAGQPPQKRRKVFSAAEPSLKNSHQAPGEATKSDGLLGEAHARSAVTSAPQAQNMVVGNCALRSQQGNGTSSNGVHSEPHGSNGASASTISKTSSARPLETEVPLGADSHPGTNSHIEAVAIPGNKPNPGANLHLEDESTTGTESRGGVDLPSLEALGVPPRWRPFAAFLRAQRKDLPDRLKDFGLPDRLLTSAEGYVPEDPVELLEFDGGDPVWLHTDLLVDNILMSKRRGAENEGTEEGGEVNPANGGFKVAEGEAKRCDDEEKGVGGQRLNGEVCRSPVEKEVGEGVVREKRETKDTGGRYEAVHILDFADARTGDPLYEIASLHIGTFRGSPELLSAFLGASQPSTNSGDKRLSPDGSPPSGAAQKSPQHARSFRAMCFAVLHEINLLNLLSRHRHVALSESLTWEQMSSMLFGVLDKN
ncbi:Phosphatidylserine-specific receptor PtdSerR [Klebsormidium nitens]|uniref:Phosphatidylserine-specific receptor PtdSerR n=1 Tax=Klebsormidium nitens TaxID=105231 RepID=A0A1Y1I0T4_KLENI|nr:Phosphatidylserine-specific receptor PtdSerR [Klebsormidium nitens]|eukprot:GAQ84534.1 Phosphatidylserine-specific receptor PtdSerR [Klebsormidium nitens]